MNDYGYDAYGNPIESGPGEADQQGPKWFREGLDKLSAQVKELRAENDALRQEQAKAQVQEAFTAKGYAPSAAALYQGDPTGVDEWLTKHGDALAKLTPAPGEDERQGQQPSGPPPSTITPEQQAQMQQISQAGTQNTAPPQGSDKELAAQIAACKSQEEYAALMAAHGNRYDWT